jgi:hypothetical protein
MSKKAFFKDSQVPVSQGIDVAIPEAGKNVCGKSTEDVYSSKS